MSPDAYEGDALARLLFHSSPDAVLIADDAGSYLEANPAACALFGYTRQRLLGMRVADLVTPDQPTAAERYARYLETGRDSGEFIFQRPDGEVRTASYSAYRLAPDRHVSVLRDVTEARRAEQERQWAARQLEETLGRVTDGFVSLDRQWRYAYANAEATRILRTPREALLGRAYWEAFPDAVGTAFEAEFRRAVEEGVTTSFEAKFTPLDTWFECRCYPSATGLSVYFRDITEDRRRAEAERRLREGQAALHELALALSREDTTEGLCRAAVELGRARLSLAAL